MNGSFMDEIFYLMDDADTFKCESKIIKDTESALHILEKELCDGTKDLSAQKEIYKKITDLQSVIYLEIARLRFNDGVRAGFKLATEISDGDPD